MILGIETSCDETAAAVVERGRIVRSNVIASQAALHAPFGGVYPEVASRQHVVDIMPVVREALSLAEVSMADIDLVAVTRGPGLSGALLVGLNAAKGIAMAAGKGLAGVNHLQGHLSSQWLHLDGRLLTPGFVDERGGLEFIDTPPLPHLALVISGGHTDLAMVGPGLEVRRLGGTLDDAAGEAFDKAARMLGLGYPGGPAIQRAANGGDPGRFKLPVGQTASPLDFSFSGLKTAVLRAVERSGGTAIAEIADDGTVPVADNGAVPVADLAASFQDAVVRAVIGRLKAALERHPEARAIAVSGGVSANAALRAALRALAEEEGLPVLLPPMELCTDNAAMIAAAAALRHTPGPPDWSLDVVSGLSIDQR